MNITSNKDIEFKLADVVKLAVENGCEMIFGGMIPEEMKRNCENNSNSLSAANLAGSTLCYNYLIPYNTAEQARKRGTRAEEIYSLMSS